MIVKNLGVIAVGVVDEDIDVDCRSWQAFHYLFDGSLMSLLPPPLLLHVVGVVGVVGFVNHAHGNL